MPGRGAVENYMLGVSLTWKSDNPLVVMYV